MIGTTVGKYRIVALLGRGATGIVFKAVDDTLDREVAIKVLSPQYTTGEFMKRFRAEATTLAKLSHPEIATIHELVSTNTDLLMVMELVRGETLEAVAERNGPMSPDYAGYVLDGILSALEHAHRAGIVHRDLKPANVMITELGGVKIMDFGIARVRGAEHLTINGGAVGTPAYMAPEQVLGEEVDGRADLYAAGVTLYRLLTGKLPFDADTPIAMLQKQVTEIPVPLHRHREGLPEWCDDVIQRALAKSPAERFQTAEEFRFTVGRAIGLTRTIDLAKAFAVSAPDVATRLEAQPMETVAISRSEAGLRSRPDADARWRWENALPLIRDASARTIAFLAGARRQLGTRGSAAFLAGIAGLCAILYWTGGTSATPSGAVRSSDDAVSGRGVLARQTRGAEVPPPRVTRPPRTEQAAKNGVATSPASAISVFPAKLVVRREGGRREEDARLSLSRARVTVTQSDEPVFSVPYEEITVIEHSRQPGWRPPKGWSRVIKIDDGVLDTIGIRDRHEISLQTDSDLVVLRLDDQFVNKVLRTLKDRTGLTAAPDADR